MYGPYVTTNLVTKVEINYDYTALKNNLITSCKYIPI